jgi:hypothetical protein
MRGTHADGSIHDPFPVAKMIGEGLAAAQTQIVHPGSFEQRGSWLPDAETANIFAVVEPKLGRHFTCATPDRSASQFAQAAGSACIRCHAWQGDPACKPVRTSPCRETGFSYIQITGRHCGACSRIVPELLPSWLRIIHSGTHHSFFPPGPQVVSLEQDPNRFSANPRNKVSFNRFLGHQAYRPARSSFWRRAANHGYNSLLV